MCIIYIYGTPSITVKYRLTDTVKHMRDAVNPPGVGAALPEHPTGVADQAARHPARHRPILPGHWGLRRYVECDPVSNPRTKKIYTFSINSGLPVWLGLTREHWSKQL